MAIRKSKVGIKQRKNKHGDTFSFRFRYEGKAITRTVGYSEKEALSVGQEIQNRLLAGKVDFAEITPEYVEQVKHELVSQASKADTAKAETKEQRKDEREDVPRAAVELASSQAVGVDAKEAPAEKTLSTSIEAKEMPPVPVAVSSDSSAITDLSKIHFDFCFFLGKIFGLDTVDAVLYGAIKDFESIPPEKGGKGYCYASIETLAERTLVKSDKTLRKHLKTLKEKGLIQVLPSKDKVLHLKTVSIDSTAVNSTAVKTTATTNNSSYCGKNYRGKNYRDSETAVNSTACCGKNYRGIAVNFTDNDKHNDKHKREREDARAYNADTSTPLVPAKKKTTRKKFVPPTLEEVMAYATGYGVDAQKFFRYYDASNWHDREGKPVKNWRLKVITWANHSSNQPLKTSTAGIISQSREETEQEREERIKRQQKELDAIGNPFDDLPTGKDMKNYDQQPQNIS